MEHLSLGEVEVHGDLVAPEPGQVVVVGELGLQLPQLLLGERCTLLPGLAAGIHFEIGVLDICRDRNALDALTCQTQGPRARQRPQCNTFFGPHILKYLIQPEDLQQVRLGSLRGDSFSRFDGS